MGELEEGYRKDKNRGSGADVGYTVEARHNYIRPCKIGNQMFDNRWQQVEFEGGPHGVPTMTIGHRALHLGFLLPYNAAQALRWWFVAAAEAGEIGGALCLETRLVKHKLKYSYEVEAIETVAESGKEG